MTERHPPQGHMQKELTAGSTGTGGDNDQFFTALGKSIFKVLSYNLKYFENRIEFFRILQNALEAAGSDREQASADGNDTVKERATVWNLSEPVSEPPDTANSGVPLPSDERFRRARAYADAVMPADGDLEPGEIRAVVDWLGLSGPAMPDSRLALHRAIEAGLPATVLRHAADRGLSLIAIARALSGEAGRRTLSRRIAKDDPLSRVESDRMVALARLAILADHVTGDGIAWLQEPRAAFGGVAGLSLVSSAAGEAVVRERLAQARDGFTA